MARLIRHDATGPVKIDPATIPAGKSLFICACGLSRNLPLCDGSHKPCATVEKPGKVYVYDNSRLKIVEERDDA